MPRDNCELTGRRILDFLTLKYNKFSDHGLMENNDGQAEEEKLIMHLPVAEVTPN
jgi:hypothetical protein